MTAMDAGGGAVKVGGTKELSREIGICGDSLAGLGFTIWDFYFRPWLLGRKGREGVPGISAECLLSCETLHQ